MKWVRYQRKGNPRYGILENNQVTEIEGNPFEEHRKTRIISSFDDIDLLPPVMPQTFYAAGINYEEHVREAATLLGTEPNIPQKADIGYRAQNALIAHGNPIIIPSDATEKVQYEGELVVVIGTEAKGMTEKNALDCVFGYTIGNDVSERSWQSSDRTLWRAKNTDSFKPMGPWIETEIDLDTLITKVRINGKETIRFKTNDMIFGVQKYISEITRYITLMPGDVIWMGTDGSSPNMKSGDICEVEISGIGVLSNPIVKSDISN